MKVRGTDRRHVKAVRRLLPDEIEAGHITALTATMHINAKEPLLFWDGCLDRVFPQWRTASKTSHQQGMSDRLLLLAIRDRLHKTPETTRPEIPKTPGRSVPLAYLVSIRLEDLAVMREEEEVAYERELAAQGPLPFFPAVPPTERHVRRAAPAFDNPVRCGRCSEWMEKEARAAHAHSRHSRRVAEIDWYSPKSFT